LQATAAAVAAGGAIGNVPRRTQATDPAIEQAINPPDEFVTPLWEREFDNSVSIRIEDSELYIVERGLSDSISPELISIDVQSGDERWRREISFAGSPEPYQDTVFVEDNGSIVAFDRSSGDRRWEYEYTPITDASTARPTFVPAGGGTLLAADEQDGITQTRLVGIDITTGDRRWEETISLPGAQTGVTLPFSESDSEEYVLFGTDNGHRIIYINVTTGDIEEEYTVPVADPISSSAQVGPRLTTTSDFFIIENRSSDTGTEVIQVFSSFERDPESVLSGDNVRTIAFDRDGEWVYLIEDAAQIRAVAVPGGDTLWEEPVSPDIVERRVASSFD